MRGRTALNPLRRNANPTGLSTPHPALRATFSRKGRRRNPRRHRCASRRIRYLLRGALSGEELKGLLQMIRAAGTKSPAA